MKPYVLTSSLSQLCPAHHCLLPLSFFVIAHEHVKQVFPAMVTGLQDPWPEHAFVFSEQVSLVLKHVETEKATLLLEVESGFTRSDGDVLFLRDGRVVSGETTMMATLRF